MDNNDDEDGDDGDNGDDNKPIPSRLRFADAASKKGRALRKCFFCKL